MSNGNNDGVWNDFWSRWESTEALPEYSRLFLKIVSRELKNSSNLLLEAGCGSGLVTVELAKQGLSCVGLDISFEAVSLAKQLAVRNHLKTNSVIFAQGDLFRMPFHSGFDVVWNAGTIEHILPDDQHVQAVNSMAKVARPGGMVIVVVPFYRSIYQLGKALGYRNGKWRFGQECSFATLKHVYERAGITLHREYCCGFMHQFDYLMYLPTPLGEILVRLVYWTKRLLGKRVMDTLNEVPGCWLVSVGIVEK